MAKAKRPKARAKPRKGRSRVPRGKRPTIILCGLAGSGKSTAARLLSKRFKLPHVSAGDHVRAVAKAKKMNLIEFGRYAEKNPEVDRAIDMWLLTRARKGGVIIDSRTTAYLARKAGVPALKVFLAVDPKTSARRVAKRDGITVRQALAASRLRELEIARRLKRLFGLDTADDSYYDVVVETDLYSPEEAVDLISRLVR